MSKPRVIIKAQSRSGKTITVFGQVIGLGINGTVTASLPAALVPNGAVSKPTADVTVNPAGEFEHSFTSCAYGTYADAIVTATNAEGSDTATSMPMTLFAPGTAPVGTPAVLFPEWAVPAFDAPTVAIGVEVTTFTLESTSGSAQTNVPFSFGQPFPSGALAPGNFLVGKIAGQADVPLQFNVLATHPNGSVRHAIISGVLPALAAGASKTVSMVRAASGTSTVPLASSAITNAGLSALVNLTIDGIVYTANASPVLAAGMAADDAYIGGAIATEYSVNVPFKKADGTDHPDLTAQFNVRHYQGANAAKIDVVVEHVKAYTAVNTISYTGEVRVGGNVVFSIPTALAHYPAARWKRTFWWGHTNPAHIRHNVPYLLDSRQVPNFDRTVTIPESVLSQYATDINKPEFALMGRGLYAAAFAGQGGRPELGLTSAWYAAAILSQDKRAKALMLALAECAGSFSIHRRDDSTGPAAGQPMDVIHFPFATSLGTASDSKNAATGGYEKLPSTSASPYGPDVSHQSSFAYLPYVVTGDLYHLEELHYWGNYNVFVQNCAYRSYERGLMQTEQVRGQAWSLRTLGQAAAITPDRHPAKQRFDFLINTNLFWYNKNYTDSLTANALGIISHGGAIVYENNQADKRGIGNFQDDFFTQSLGHLAELGHAQAARMLRWKAKWQVSRLIGQGICWIDAVLYAPTVRAPNGGPIYLTIAEVMEATAAYGKYTTPAIQALPCNSPARLAEMNDPTRVLGDLGGYPTSTEGFAANLQPALAYAVDNGYPDADLAWGLFESRTVKPDYGYGAQFAIVPRGYIAPEETDPTPDPDPDPQPTDIETMAIADNVKDSTTTTGAGSLDLANAPQTNYQSWYPAIPIGERAPYSIKHRTLPEWENGWGHLSEELVFVRDAVTASSNNGELVPFSVGIKDISCDLTASFVEELAGKHNATVEVISSDPANTMLLVEVDGALQKISLGDAGQTFMQMTAFANPVGTDEFAANRGGADGRFTFTSICAGVKAYIDAQGPTDTAAPQLLSAQVSNATPNVILLTFNETLGPYTPAAAAFAVSGGKSVTGVTRNGASLSVTVSANYAYGDTISITYTKPATNPIQDMTGNPTASFGPSGVVNNIAAPGDTVLPTVSTAAVANASPSTVTITASEPLDAAYAPATSAFTVAGHTVSAVAISGSAISLTVTPAFVNGEAARTAAYTQPATNGVRDLAGNLMASFSGQTITNNVAAAATAPGAPTIGTITAGDGSVTVPFTAPASNGGSAITSYAVSVYKVSDNTLVASGGGSASPVTITGIANGTAVYAKVAAVNSVGTGAQSAASNSVTPAAAAPAYTITGYNGNAVKSSISTATVTPTYNGSVQKGFDATKLCTLSGYWNISPTPASARSGWSNSATTPPADVTANSQNTSSGDSSVNGMCTMSHPGAWADNSYCWVPATPGTYTMYYWVKPVDGVAQMKGSISITVA